MTYPKLPRKQTIIATSCSRPFQTDGEAGYKVHVKLAVPYTLDHPIPAVAQYETLDKPTGLYINDKLAFNKFSGIDTYERYEIIYNLHPHPLLQRDNAFYFVRDHLKDNNHKIHGLLTYADMRQIAFDIISLALENSYSMVYYDVLLCVCLYKFSLLKESNDIFLVNPEKYRGLWYSDYLCILIDASTPATDLRGIWLFLAANFYRKICETEFYLVANSILSNKINAQSVVNKNN